MSHPRFIVFNNHKQKVPPMYDHLCDEDIIKIYEKMCMGGAKLSFSDYVIGIGVVGACGIVLLLAIAFLVLPWFYGILKIIG